MSPLRSFTMDENLVLVYRHQIIYNSTSTAVSGQIRAYCALENISAIDTSPYLPENLSLSCIAGCS